MQRNEISEQGGGICVNMNIGGLGKFMNGILKSVGVEMQSFGCERDVGVMLNKSVNGMLELGLFVKEQEGLFVKEG